MTPDDDVEDIDPGLARERTELAWHRTAISVAALGAAILRIRLAAGVTILIISAVVWELGRLSRVPGAGRARPAAPVDHCHHHRHFSCRADDFLPRAPFRRTPLTSPAARGSSGCRLQAILFSRSPRWLARAVRPPAGHTDDHAQLFDRVVDDPVADRLAIAAPAQDLAGREPLQMLRGIRRRGACRRRDLAHRGLAVLVEDADDLQPGGVTQQREPPSDVLDERVRDNGHARTRRSAWHASRTSAVRDAGARRGLALARLNVTPQTSSSPSPRPAITRPPPLAAVR